MPIVLVFCYGAANLFVNNHSAYHHLRLPLTSPQLGLYNTRHPGIDIIDMDLDDWPPMIRLLLDSDEFK
jgi:hypothetical protein